MQHRPVVPQVVGRLRLPGQKVAGDSSGRESVAGETGAHELERLVRDVQDRDVDRSLGQELIDQRRGSCAHVDDTDSSAGGQEFQERNDSTTRKLLAEASGLKRLRLAVFAVAELVAQVRATGSRL